MTYTSRYLTLTAPSIKMKTNLIFFTPLCGASKGFIKAFKTFIKPLEAPQTSVKIKIFSLRYGGKVQRFRNHMKSIAVMHLQLYNLNILYCAQILRLIYSDFHSNEFFMQNNKCVTKPQSGFNALYLKKLLVCLN